MEQTRYDSEAGRASPYHIYIYIYIYINIYIYQASHPTKPKNTVFTMGQAQSTPNLRRIHAPISEKLHAPISEKFPNHDSTEDGVMVEKTGESYDGNIRSLLQNTAS